MQRAINHPFGLYPNTVQISPDASAAPCLQEVEALAGVRWVSGSALHTTAAG